MRVEGITFEGVTAKLESDLREQMRTPADRPVAPGAAARPVRGGDADRGHAHPPPLPALPGLRPGGGGAAADHVQRGPHAGPDRDPGRLRVRAARSTPSASPATACSPTDQILKVVALRRGDPWDPTKTDEARRKVEQLYQRRGYFRTVVSAKVTEVGDGVTVAFDLVEGELTRVGRVLISGLTATQARRGGARAADQAGRSAQRGRPQRDPAPTRRHAHLRPGRRRGAGAAPTRPSATSRSRCGRPSRGASSSASGTPRKKASAASSPSATTTCSGPARAPA